MSLLIRKNPGSLIPHVPLLRVAPISQKFLSEISQKLICPLTHRSFLAKKKKHVSLDALQMRCRPEARAGDTPWRSKTFEDLDSEKGIIIQNEHQID